MNGRAAGLDPRSWLIWAVAASVPVLVGRNPFPIVVVLLASTLVYTSLPRSPASRFAQLGSSDSRLVRRD